MAFVMIPLVFGCVATSKLARHGIRAGRCGCILLARSCQGLQRVRVEHRTTRIQKTMSQVVRGSASQHVSSRQQGDAASIF
jgi:hypothetical protein